MPESEFKRRFDLHPETLIEAEEFLRQHGGTYETYLASEVGAALDESYVDRSEYREASCSGGDDDGG